MGVMSTKCDETPYQNDSMCILAIALCYHNYSSLNFILIYSNVILFFSYCESNVDISMCSSILI